MGGIGAGRILPGVVVLGFLVALTACSSDSEPAPTAAVYLAGLESACTVTATALAALPDPPDGITVTDFATQAGAILRSEAESIRALAPTDELEDDHRALIQNDEEQAAAWSDVAAAGGGPAVDADALDALTTKIAQLNLGRDDLVTEMGAPSCVRTPG